MKHINKIFSVVIAVGLLLSSCDKDDDIASNEKTLVKLPQAASELNIVAIESVPGEVAVDVLEIRRDAINQAALNAGGTVLITKNPSLIDEYNDAHGTDYEEFTQFTAGDGITYDGTTFTVPFASGDFVKFLQMKLSPTSLDLTKKYAFGFTVSDAGSGAAISNGLKDVLVEIAIKNAWHGTYEAVGVFHHPTAGDRAINELKLLATSGPRSVTAYLGDLGPDYQMILTVNTDNTVTIAPAGATPNIDQHWGPNYYDPITKKFHLHYSYNTAAPRIVEETLSFKN